MTCLIPAAVLRRVAILPSVLTVYALILVLPGAARTALAQPTLPVGVYSARVPVDDRLPQTLRSAQRDGLAQVLMKASGSDLPEENGALLEALEQAASYLLGYSYEEKTGRDLLIRLDYDERRVQELLRDAGLPLWTSNRPVVLAWLVVNDGQRGFASLDRAATTVDALNGSFERRGVPLQQPLHDLEDAAAISVGEAWRQDSAALVRASERYGEPRILTGRMATLSDGRVSGDWRFLDQGRWLTRSLRAVTLQEFTDAGAALVASRLAARYAVRGAPGDIESGYHLQIRGVRSFADYAKLREALLAMEAVSYLAPERLQGDLVQLRVEADAERERFQEILQLDRRFVPVPVQDDFGLLEYEWLP